MLPERKRDQSPTNLTTYTNSNKKKETTRSLTCFCQGEEEEEKVVCFFIFITELENIIIITCKFLHLV